jgi:hypothetical protein
LIFVFETSYMLLWSTRLIRMLRRQYVLHTFEFLNTTFAPCFILMLIDFLQILELNDENNWRNGLRVRLLNTCMVSNKWYYLSSVVAQWDIFNWNACTHLYWPYKAGNFTSMHYFILELWICHYFSAMYANATSLLVQFLVLLFPTILTNKYGVQ